MGGQGVLVTPRRGLEGGLDRPPSHPGECPALLESSRLGLGEVAAHSTEGAPESPLRQAAREGLGQGLRPKFRSQCRQRGVWLGRGPRA